MTKKVMQKWVKALRSGKYKQGRHALKNKVDGEYEYCCLGVAVKIGLCNAHYSLEIASSKFLDVKIQEKLAEFNDGKEVFRNDGLRLFKPKSFEYIASYIEKNYKNW